MVNESEVNELLQVARKWVRDVQSGRKLGAGVRMQMYGLVHAPLGSGGLECDKLDDKIALWRAFEACVNLGIEQLLGSPSSIRELYSRLDAMAHFHQYAQALSFGFCYLGRFQGGLEAVPAAKPFFQRLGHVSEEDRPRVMAAILKLMLQDQLGLSPVLQHSPMDAQNVERIETLLLPILAAHPAGYSNWLLPATFTFVPQCKPKIKLAFVLCSTRAESPVRTLPIELIKRILRLAAGHLRFDGERNVVAQRLSAAATGTASFPR